MKRSGGRKPDVDTEAVSYISRALPVLGVGTGSDTPGQAWMLGGPGVLRLMAETCNVPSNDDTKEAGRDGHPRPDPQHDGG